MDTEDCNLTSKERWRRPQSTKVQDTFRYEDLDSRFHSMTGARVEQVRHTGLTGYLDVGEDVASRLMAAM